MAGVVELYAPDGRQITVWKSEVPAYCSVGWYQSTAGLIQTLYAPDGRTVNVWKSEVPSYCSLGWYENRDAAAGAVTKSSEPSYQPSASAGTYSENNSETVYITKTGSKYRKSGCRHLSKSKIPISLSDAKARGYAPCQTCH